MKWAKQVRTRGFTIVELLIVIVVIGILAAITIIAFNGVKNRAVASQVQSAITQASQKVQLYALDNNGQYPTQLSDVGVSDTDSVSFQYVSDNTTSTPTFSLTASNGPAGTIAYGVTNANLTPSEGIAPGNNLIVWDKSAAGLTSTNPVPAATAIDTTVFHTATASERLGVGATGKPLRGAPFTGVTGQIYTVTLWMKTDSNWNGTGSNSKIRVGENASGTLLLACGYNGVKVAWTQVSCSYTMTSSAPINISVGNDGTVGNIWLDDIVVSSSQ